LTLNDISNNIISEKLVYGMIQFRPLLKLFTIITILIIVLSSTCFSGVRFVSKTGSSTPPYLTWETASDSIQKCINICNNGDTVYVANGVYKEFLTIDSNITIQGSSMDSTILDGTGLYIRTIDCNSDFTILNFNIIGSSINGYTYGIVNPYHNTFIKNCRLMNSTTALELGETSGTIENVIITNCKTGVFTFCGSDTCKPKVLNSLIYIDDFYSGIPAIFFYDGGIPVIENNLIIGNNSDYAILGYSLKSASVMNNLIIGFTDGSIELGVFDTCDIINNTIGYEKKNFGWGSVYNVTDHHNTKNNIFYKNWIAVEGPITFGKDYNLYWGNNLNVKAGTLNTHEIEADPMFVKDTIPSGLMNFDFHLQKYSPAIDSGDPSILDRDGTRSDMGYLGGPGGETYTYKDLAPRAPVGLNVKADSGKIVVKWNRNTEADFKSYKLYRDTVQHFTADTTKLVSTQADTIFIQVLPANWKKFYYKLTATDNQGNESPLSEEIGIITGINDKPQMVSEYRLFQNYPNPFNPSTKISYRLKEAGYVKIIIYDIKGALVRVLINATQEMGYYEPEFNAKGLASGVYLYRIEVTGKGNIPVYSDMKKMIYLK
jgi:hypothetical protein